LPWSIRHRFPFRHRSNSCRPSLRHEHKPRQSQPCGTPELPMRTARVVAFCTQNGKPCAPPRGQKPPPWVRFLYRQRPAPAASSVEGFPTRADVAPRPSLMPRPASENLHQCGRQVPFDIFSKTDINSAQKVGGYFLARACLSVSPATTPVAAMTSAISPHCCAGAARCRSEGIAGRRMTHSPKAISTRHDCLSLLAP
jgi:hypothetical protein